MNVLRGEVVALRELRSAQGHVQFVMQPETRREIEAAVSPGRDNLGRCSVRGGECADENVRVEDRPKHPRAYGWGKKSGLPLRPPWRHGKLGEWIEIDFSSRSGRWPRMHDFVWRSTTGTDQSRSQRPPPCLPPRRGLVPSVEQHARAHSGNSRRPVLR